MTGKGVKPTQMFLVDGNTSDYSKDFQAGTLKGARGTIPGTVRAGRLQEEAPRHRSGTEGLQLRR